MKKNQPSYAIHHLPPELRQLVRISTNLLGIVIEEFEGKIFFNKVENYRTQLKSTRIETNQTKLESMLAKLKKESASSKLKLAHAFALQLELVNACEAAYRTWRLRQSSNAPQINSTLNLTYVLTAHPTESRSKVMVEIFNHIERILLSGIQNSFNFNEQDLLTQIRFLWLHPLSKSKSPSVIDEAEYIYTLLFAPTMIDFILEKKESYNIRLRTWVGGDKDGHPYVNKEVMKQSLNHSRRYILASIRDKLQKIKTDLLNLEINDKKTVQNIAQIDQLDQLLNSLEVISTGDGNRLLTWFKKLEKLQSQSGLFVKKHHQMILINRMIELFPGLVLPNELREDSELIKKALNDKQAIIRGMIAELSKIAGKHDITAYTRGLVISHCERAQDITNANLLVQSAGKVNNLPIIPLFESREALLSSRKILQEWLDLKANRDQVLGHWEGKFETMLGYSDSSKQIGVLPSRYLIAKAMLGLEKKIKSYGIRPIFFHGSGGSIDRGGGSIKEQVAWWPNSAVETPKFTVQGEMIQRQFASKEILNSQCLHFSHEFMLRKKKKLIFDQGPILEHFIQSIERHYTQLVEDTDNLNTLLAATPYRYLDVLKIGSRPTKRQEGSIVSLNSLRAIPWVLCWTQTRNLWPTWWGIGSAWKELSSFEREKIIADYKSNPFLSSFVKALGFTLAKVELDVWELYFGNNPNPELFKKFRDEFRSTVSFVRAITGEKKLVWYRPWLEESIRMRTPTIHILNLLQILAIEADDESLLRETLAGIACGMMTTG